MPLAKKTLSEPRIGFITDIIDEDIEEEAMENEVSQIINSWFDQANADEDYYAAIHDATYSRNGTESEDSSDSASEDIGLKALKLPPFKNYLCLAYIEDYDPDDNFLRKCGVRQLETGSLCNLLVEEDTTGKLKKAIEWKPVQNIKPVKIGLHPEAAEKLNNDFSRIPRTLSTPNLMHSGVWGNIRGRISSALGEVSKLVKPTVVRGISAVHYDKAEEALEISYGISKASLAVS